MTEGFHHAIEVEDLGKLKKKVTVTYDAEGVRNTTDVAIAEVAKQVQIKGFRKGHAPLLLVKSYCSDKVKLTVTSMLSQKCYLHSCNEYGFLVLSEPVFEEPEFKESGEFVCVFTIEVRPKIDPVGYVGLQLTKSDINKEQIFNQLFDELKQSHQSEKQLTIIEDRSMVTVDFDVLLNNVKINSGANQPFFVTAMSSLPFGSNLIGKLLGEVCVEKFILPKEYENYGGEEVDVQITIKSIIKKVEPTNEELVTRTESPSYEELINLLHRKTDQIAQKRQMAALEELAIDKILELHDFDVPESWVENESKYMLAQFGVEKAPDEQTAEFVNNMATRNVRRTFMLESIYEAEPNLKITQADLELVIDAEAKRNGVSSLVVKKEWQEKNLLQSVLASIKHQKVMKFILENSQISEVEVFPSASLIVENVE